MKLHFVDFGCLGRSKPRDFEAEQCDEMWKCKSHDEAINVGRCKGHTKEWPSKKFEFFTALLQRPNMICSRMGCLAKNYKLIYDKFI